MVFAELRASCVRRLVAHLVRVFPINDGHLLDDVDDLE